MNYILSIDIGTSSTKTAAFSTKGQLLAKVSEDYETISPSPEIKEQDPEEVYQAVMKAIQTVEKAVKGSPTAIVLGSAMHSIIAMDENGKPLTNCIIWSDNRSVAHAMQLKNTEQGRQIYHHTGVPLHPMSPLFKIAWLRDHQPDVHKKADKFISIKEYLIYKWFGEYIVDYSIASATGLFDIRTLDWYSPALQYAGIQKEQVSKPVPTTHILKGIKVELDIPTETPVVVGASDGCLANLGTMAITEGKVAVTIGTSGAIRSANKEILYDPKERLFNYILTEDLYITGGATNNGGIIYEWFSEIFPKITDLSYFEKLAAEVSPGAEGLLFLPYLQGERAPVWDAHARGMFIGLTTHHKTAHLTRAVLEGILFNIYQIGEVIKELDGQIDQIYANGGFTKSEVGMQILADIFNVEVCTGNGEESPALGGAILALKALGEIDSFEEAAEWIQSEKTFFPNTENHAIYQQYYAIFKNLYSKLNIEFEQLSKLP